MRVLVAEDAPVLRAILHSTLARWGYDIIVATDGDEAWKELQKPDAPALLVLDWEMPGRNGIDLCRELRAGEDSRQRYIILLTGRDSTEDLVEGLEAGANDYVRKPFDPAELQARVDVGRRYVELYDELMASKQAFEQLARTDSLTQTMNRRAVYERLDEEIARARRDHSTLAVGVLDVDHFKCVNDTYGHATGDEVLRAVVHRVAEATRLYDHIGRLGGEEFLLIVPGATPESGRAVLERARLAVCASPVRHALLDVQVTISMGCATTDGQESGDAVLTRADQALYRAKRLGRNRVEMAG